MSLPFGRGEFRSPDQEKESKRRAPACRNDLVALHRDNLAKRRE
jgi:hypothetical protein